ncbi:hypothetical protein [Streptomyces sp. Ac-502]|uniref:hypothetical protein n=1 Tax=Streptomyces sp. Ac-502 TaxID=3342801 RepID=UPI003862CDFD
MVECLEGMFGGTASGRQIGAALDLDLAGPPGQPPADRAKALRLGRELEGFVLRLAAQQLRAVVAADRTAFGPVPAETRRQAEQEW